MGKQQLQSYILIKWETLGKFSNLFVPQLAQLQNGMMLVPTAQGYR